MLVQLLKINWPGCLVPQIPAHKIFKLKNENIIQDRCHLLQLFYADCSRCPYIANSEEFKDFGRANIEYSKVFK